MASMACWVGSEGTGGKEVRGIDVECGEGVGEEGSSLPPLEPILRLISRGKNSI